jgi:carbonic anhydrase/acetyltransferase-like protein (isoleucine patch superfamily)
MHPKIAASAFIEESAQVVGDVVVGEHASIWFNAVVRGDVNYVRIGRETNVQDGSVLHVFIGAHPLILGDRVTVGHAVTLHGCTIEDECLIGMGAIVLNGARVGRGSMIAAGAVVTEGTQIEPGSLYAGVPAKMKRSLDAEALQVIRRYASNYVVYKDAYLGHPEAYDALMQGQKKND